MVFINFVNKYKIYGDMLSKAGLRFIIKYRVWWKKVVKYFFLLNFIDF